MRADVVRGPGHDEGGDHTRHRRPAGPRRLIRLVAVVALVTTVAGCDWAMYGYGPSHTRVNSTETAINPTNARTLAARWRGPTGGPVQTSPAVAGGIVYVGSDDGKLDAYDATGTTGCTGTPKTCQPLWTATTGGPVQSSPAVAGGTVYVGSNDGKLYAYDATGTTGCTGTPKTCQPLWTATTGGPVGALDATPAVANGVVLVDLGDRQLHAYDAAGTTGCIGTPRTCRPLWSSGETGFGPAIIANGVVYAGSADHALHAFGLSPPTPELIDAAGDIVGDCSTPPCGYSLTSDKILATGPQAVLALGDISNLSGAATDYSGPFDSTWGRFKPIIHPVPGNHDYGAADAKNYYAYFGAASQPDLGYYSFDLGAWHVLAINSNCTDLAGGCGVDSTEEQWVRADLAADTAPCTLAFWHHPRYSSGHDGDNTFMAPIWADLYAFGADVVLSGHSHDYERFGPQDNASQSDPAHGIVQFVVGTGGSFFTGFGTPHANSLVRNNTTFGVLRMTLGTSGYAFQFDPVGGGTFTDSGQATCHHATP